jgi:predicted unusual protein kinase regulating ubiquinone biosynthesis (AarF/ABC1/UbiB family)
MALSLLLLKLVPFAILPLLLDKFTNYDNVDYESSKAHRLRKKSGNMFADGLLKLGPLYIKIGQILSCRENLFPKEWISAMEKLQDRVPAKNGKEAWTLAYDAIPGGKARFHSIFSEFDDIPLAAASLGQVHKATLRDSGDIVAIKIQRSRLRDIYDKDLKLMKTIARAVDSFGGQAGMVGGVQQSWTDIFNDAETILYREIDYRDEAENAIRFANDFGLGIGGTRVESTAKGVDGNTLPSASEWLRSPYTYKELCSEKFLVMEFVPSIKVSSNDKLEEAGVTVEDREYLAEALAHSYLRQFCVNKFFSTDPHPGNLGIETFEDGRPPRLVFYDFGQACSLAEDQSVGILEVIESIIDSDAKKSVVAFQRMGVLKDGADLAKVEAKCQSNYDTGKLKVKKRKKRKSARYSAMSQPEESEVKSKDSALKSPKNETAEVKDSEVMEYFTLQSEYAFVARALSQMDGVGKGLDPDFDFISAAAPYLVEIKGTRKYLVDEAKKKLKFVYDPEEGMLAKEMSLFKSLGFEPKKYRRQETKM